MLFGRRASTPAAVSNASMGSLGRRADGGRGAGVRPGPTRSPTG